MHIEFVKIMQMIQATYMLYNMYLYSTTTTIFKKFPKYCLHAHLNELYK